MSKQEDEFLKKLISVFRIESKERGEKLASYLLELQQEKNEDKKRLLIETIYREIHSLKSAARAVNFVSIEKICKELEDVFFVYKQKTLFPKEEQYDILHSAVNFILDIVGKQVLEINTEENQKLEQLLAVIRNNNVPQEATSDVKAHSTATSLNKPKKEITKKEVLPKTNNAKPQVEQSKVLPKAEEHIDETVRISTNKLDSLLAQVEEMITSKLNLLQRVSDVYNLKNEMNDWNKEWTKILDKITVQSKQSTSSKNLSPLSTHEKDLAEIADLVKKHKEINKKIDFLANRLEHNSQALSSGIEILLEDTKKLLMWPFSTLLTPFPRTTRELARAQNKDVNLILEGTDVEIDKRILEEMKDVILHLIRNAIDHGVEDKAERKRLNKPEKATLKISIQQLLGNKISVEISDDGSGIKINDLKNLALKQNLLSLEEVNSMSEQEALNLIYHSGMSTSPILTDLSGRGLGMSIVKEKIEKVSGEVTVASKPHIGTTFKIILPLTLATFKGVLIEVSNQLFIIPTSNLERIIRVKSENIKTVENREVISYEGKTTSLVRLNEILNLSRDRNKSTEMLPVMIISSSDTTIAFVVDDIHHEQEIIVKNFNSPINHVQNIAAAAILETGKPVPILNSLELLQAAQQKAIGKLTVIEEKDMSGEQRTILLVEDSMSTRMLLKNVLELGGYQVTTAVDGLDAWQRLQTDKFTIVVSDVEMPRMNGFELTEKIRKSKKMDNLPIVLVTSRETDQDKAHGIEVGANAYLPKSTFDSSHLLEVIQRLTI